MQFMSRSNIPEYAVHLLKPRISLLTDNLKLTNQVNIRVLGEMAGSTISTTISTEVTLGSGVNVSPLTITSAGRIIAPGPTNSFQTASAIYAGTGLTGDAIINHGKIIGGIPASGSYFVPAVLSFSAISLNNYGTIAGQGGVYLDAGGTVTNSGHITGSDAVPEGGYGVRLVNATLSNSGTVTGASYGVASWNQSNVVNTKTVSGKIDGVRLETSTIGTGGTLLNKGDIYGTLTGVSAASALITNSGVIAGATYGIDIAWGTTIVNSGIITGGFDGVLLLNQLYQAAYDSSLQNSGSIHGGYFGVAVNFANVSNLASGDIVGQTFGAGVGESGYLYNAGTLSGGKAGLFEGNAGVAVNAGTISGTIGIYIESAAVLTNSAAGYISGQSVGGKIEGGYLNNMASITGQNYGLQLFSGGIVVNSGGITSKGEGVYLSSLTSSAEPDFLENSGTIYGKTGGIKISNGTVYSSGSISGGPVGVALIRGGMLTNTGVISGQTYGVKLAGGTVVNSGGITGGATGVMLNHGYLTNSGTITGATHAVYGSSFSLTLDAGAVFGGNVADTTGSSTLNLGGAAFGTVTGIGSQFSGFSHINFDPGTQWMISGNIAGFAAGETISGFAMSDTIVLTGFAATSETFVAGKGLELTAGSTTVTIDITGSFSLSNFIVTDPPNTTTITLKPAPCFVTGTRILTPRGQIPVEDLAVGDTVITHEGDDRAIIWIGRRGMDLRRHPHPREVQPVCIAAGALAEGVPSRDLWVSPDHALYIDGVLLPARQLLNESNIYQSARKYVTYYHIELAEHAMIFAENAAAETYLETGNRAAFENAVGATILHPDFGTVMRNELSCAPLLGAGDILDKIRMRILQRFDGSQAREEASAII